MKKISITIIALLCSLVAHGSSLPTASFVDIGRYIGKWYAVASMPQFFTRNCQSQTAEYEIIDDKTISVFNTCFKSNGKTTIKGKAVVINTKTNAELVVTFDNFFTRLFGVKGDYTIIKLDENYEYVMVGSKDRKSLWIMSRRPEMPAEVLKEYKTIAKSLKFNI